MPNAGAVRLHDAFAAPCPPPPLAAADVHVYMGWLTCAKQRSRYVSRPSASSSYCVGFRGSPAKRPRKAPRLEPKQLLAIMGTVNILRPAKVARLFFLFVFHGLAVAVFAGFLTAYLPETPCTAMGPQTPTLENTSGATGPYAHTAQ